LSIGSEDESLDTELDRSMVWKVDFDVTHEDVPKDVEDCILAEAPDGNDGPPKDSYDSPNPPTHPSPFIEAYLDDNLPMPYSQLITDCRMYPDSYKIFNMTISYDTAWYNNSKNVTIEWYITGLDQIEYSDIIMVNTKTGDYISILQQDIWNIKLEELEYNLLKILCGLTHVELAKNWNFISTYYIDNTLKSDSIIWHNQSTYSWNNAVNNSVIVDYIFKWDSLSQSYLSSDNFESGYGYWLWSYEPCYLWVKNTSIPDTDIISDLNTDWNMIGTPFFNNVSKTDLTVEWNNTNYTWSDAVTQGIVNDFIFGWNSSGQYYTTTDMIESGGAYWIYSYEPCKLKRTT
jgi:hypothetical protein